MEVQKKQMTKQSRMAVPFYSPPTRHYGQTPSEIIREARASVMSPPTTGIKPVLTSRPFTPKDKERVLFGNAKRLSRPPSSFSLSYLQKSEALPRIKLPAIGNLSKNKISRNSSIRTVHSLDYLIEEYEAEIQEDSKQLDFNRLPFFRDTHSSPQERRQSHNYFSNKDEISTKVPEKRSIYTLSQRCIENIIPYGSENSCSDYLECQNRNSQDFLNLGYDKLNHTVSNRYTEQELECMQNDLSNSKRKLNDNNAINLVGEKSCHKACNVIGDILKDKEGSILKWDDRGGAKILPMVTVQHETELHTIQDEYSGFEFAKNGHQLTEKAVETEKVSDYLRFSSKRSADSSELDSNKAKEIIEMYETAEYYGVFKNESKIDDFEAKEEDNKKNANDNTNHLETMRENIKNFDLRMKMLNENIGTFEEKLSGKNGVYCSDNEIDIKTNDYKRYHSSRDACKEKKEQTFLYDTQYFGTRKTQTQTAGWDGFWKNSYFRQKLEDESTGSGEYSELRQLQHCVERLRKLEKTDEEDQEIPSLTNEMYQLLKRGELIEKHLIDNETKLNILQALYYFADNEHAEILLNLARIVFALKMESSLSIACKMVFKVARSDANDHWFMEIEDILELFLEGIGRASPLDVAECCIYGYGALKFLTMNHIILNRLISLGVLDLLILHLKIINAAKLEGHIVNEQTQHSLFQLTGALRNIAAGDGVLSLFITTNSIPVLCKMLINFRHSEDLVTNISRTLSLISADEDAIDILLSVENILATFVELMEEYKANDKILIRLSYCLGNIVAYNDLARVQLSRSEGSVMILLKLLQLYLEKDLELAMKESSSEGLDNEVIDDIIVKVIRIIANMCMNPVVGSNLSPNEGNESNSLKLSHLLTTLLQRKDPGIALLACLGCLNNISYYCGNHSSLVDITEGVVRALCLHDEECQAEAARVLGNLTRHKEIRDLISTTGGVKHLLRLLDSKNKDVYRSVCGALVNLMLDYGMRKEFAQSGGVDKLVDGLDKYSGDWSFAALICRAIWNSCVEDFDTVMSHNSVERLLNILAHSLDEENWNDGDPAWEEFAYLATDLLEKINSHLEL